MTEEGNVWAEGSALVEQDKDLDDLRRSTTALMKIMRTVLQRTDAMVSVQEGTNGQNAGCGESFAFDNIDVEAGERVADLTGRGAASIQGSSPPRTARAQGPSPTEQRMVGPTGELMAGPTEQRMAGSNAISRFILLVEDFTVVVTVSGVPSMGGAGGIRLPQGPKFDSSGTKFLSWVNAKQYGLLRRYIHR